MGIKSFIDCLPNPTIATFFFKLSIPILSTLFVKSAKNKKGIFYYFVGRKSIKLEYFYGKTCLIKIDYLTAFSSGVNYVLPTFKTTIGSSPLDGGGDRIRTCEAVRLWFSRPVQLTAMRHLLVLSKPFSS